MEEIKYKIIKETDRYREMQDRLAEQYETAFLMLLERDDDIKEELIKLNEKHELLNNELARRHILNLENIFRGGKWYGRYWYCEKVY